MTMTRTPLPQAPGAPRDLIFISYSHRDRDWLGHLQVFLKPYTRQNLKIWADPYIEVGGRWRRDIAAALCRSRVGVLLLSHRFSRFRLHLLRGAAAASRRRGSRVDYSGSHSGKCQQLRGDAPGEHQFAHPPDRPLDKMRRPEGRRGLSCHLRGHRATPEDIAVGGTVHQPFVDEPISLSGAVDSTFSIA
jgi:TIR domain